MRPSDIIALHSPLLYLGPQHETIIEPCAPTSKALKTKCRASLIIMCTKFFLPSALSLAISYLVAYCYIERPSLRLLMLEARPASHHCNHYSQGHHPIVDILEVLKHTAVRR